MIGESYLLGPWWYPLRPVHQSWARLIVTLSPAAGSHQPCNLQWSASITHGWHYHHLLSTAGFPPRTPPSFIFYFKHV